MAKSILIKFIEEQFVTNDGEYRVLLPINLDGEDASTRLYNIGIIFNMEEVGGQIKIKNYEVARAIEGEVPQALPDPYSSITGYKEKKYFIQESNFLEKIKVGYNEFGPNFRKFAIRKYMNEADSADFSKPPIESTSQKASELMGIVNDMKLENGISESSRAVQLAKWKKEYELMNLNFDNIDLDENWDEKFGQKMLENIFNNEELIIEDVESKFIFDLFKTLYTEPKIVQLLFAKKVGNIYNNEGVLISKPMTGPEITSTHQPHLSPRRVFEPGNMDISLIRKDSYIAKNMEYMENPAEVEKPSDKAEGIFCYSTNVKSTSITEKDFVLGWVPFVKYINKDVEEVSCISRRKVKFNFKFQLNSEQNSFSEEYVEYGWIFPDAMNETNTEEKKLYDNKLLFHWTGDSLGCESIFEKKDGLDDSEDDFSDNEIEEFINRNLFEKEIGLPENQIPLKEGVHYEFALVPMNILGDWPLKLNERIEKTLIPEDFASLNQPFKVIEPISPPVLVLKQPNVDYSKKNSSILLRHQLSENGDRYVTLHKEYILFPPKVDVNIARWLGTFELKKDEDFEKVYKWVERTEKEVWEEKHLPVGNVELWYTFDKRVLSNNLILELYELEYNEAGVVTEKILGKPLVVNPDKDLGKQWSSMEDVRGINLFINSVEASKDAQEIKADFLKMNSVQKRVEVHIPQGKQIILKYGYEGKDNPMSSTKIINAVAKLRSDDAGRELKFTDLKISSTDTRTVEYEISLELENINFNIAEHFYLFRKYKRVNPTEWNQLPTVKNILATRNKNEEVDEYLVNKETDKVLFNTLKIQSDQESAVGFLDDMMEKANEVESIIRDKVIEINGKKSIFNEENVFEINEVFTENRVELLNPKQVAMPDNVQVIDNKIGFGKINGIGNFNFKAKFDDTDKRAKKIDYVSTKIYSKHLGHFSKDIEKKGKKILLDLDLNKHSVTQAQITDGLVKNEDNIITEIAPPKFETELIFLTEENKVDESIVGYGKRTLLLITFGKDELNLLSDEDYFGIDFSKDTIKVGGTTLESNKTDLGVDFTYNTSLDKQIKAEDVVVPLDFRGEKKLMFNVVKSTKYRDVIVVPVPDGEIAFTKPLFLYEQNKGFILWDVSSMMSTNNELDPFLKLSLCRGYFTDINNKKTIRTLTSKPRFIQLSSERNLEIERGNGKIIIRNQNSYKSERKERVHYLIAFYSGKNKNDLEQPILIHSKDKEKDNYQSYVLLANPSNMSSLVSVSNNSYVIENSNNKVSQVLDGKLVSLNLKELRLKLFEFHTYDNYLNKPENTILNMINTDNFNPFNNSNFKLIFTL